MKIRHYSIMEECYICFERKKLYNICKTCNHNICDKCIITMIDENNVYFTYLRKILTLFNYLKTCYVRTR